MRAFPFPERIVLDLSRLEYDRLQLRKEKLSINELIDETVQDISYSDLKHQVKVIRNFHCKGIADKDRLGQVLINFITNALKFSHEDKKVKVTVSQAHNEQVALCIRDNGIGIIERDLEKIFQRFYRTPRTEEDTYSNFGIGLFLAREIVECHEGKVEVESILEKDSVFTFYLPYLQNVI